MGSEGFLPDLGRKGVYPPMFSEECASRFIPDGYESMVFRSAQVLPIVGVAEMPKSSENARDCSLYYLSDIVPQL